MPSRGPASTRASTRSWLIWLTAASVYVLAVFHRTSFGVAGLEAADRFGVGAAALSTFTVLQLGVYAVMQIPTGVLVDRYGPRNILTAALVFLSAGQILIAVASTYTLGLVARGVLGLGDAMTFVSVLRLAANHFPARQYMFVTALTGALGFAGNLAATLPLTLLLAGPGWLPTFLGAGLVTIVFVGVVQWRVHDTPTAKVVESPSVPAGEIGKQVLGALRVPGTRLGFWTHFSTMFGQNVLVLLWGVPYLVQGQGYSVTTASSLLMVFVVGAMCGGPFVGTLVGRRPEVRMPLVLGFLGGSALVWAVLLSWPGTVPIGVLIPSFLVLSFGGPVSSVGFALARDYNPLPRVGTATGVVNVGGFCATTITALLIGVLLELTGGDFRIALSSVVVVLAFGSWRMFVWYRRARAAVFAAQARGESVPVRLRRHRWDVAREQERVAATV
ncbi:MFS transporter [Prauserella marina]|uniref:Sugar phosphate permease n=1 Tax=Prauserella marina TaxID=530584 RepID=A0A222VN81_9PSEU|nr:MFS transporter [Prauserella marina]ASR35334.1 MFS transporter [Prauserella marina]PWV84876.1 sugar phosphate permease [Prauserella marina]SDC10735.1 Sugar phosphate permease [Prauserella marina]